VTGGFIPGSYVFAIPESADLPPELEEKSAGNGGLAYVCEGMQCSPPISSEEQWAALINDSKACLQPS
jgi:uncharacterized protein YyaL (SSP411 family)